jgi:hypothetical protein
MHHSIRVQLNGVFWKLIYIKLFLHKRYLKIHFILVNLQWCDSFQMGCWPDYWITWLQMNSISTRTHCKLLKVKRGGFQVCRITLFDLKVGCPKLLVMSNSLLFHISIVMFNSFYICYIIRYMENTNQDLILFLSMN